MSRARRSSGAPRVRLPTPAEIDAALADLEKPLAQYLWLTEQVRLRDVANDREFQRRYDRFWRVRKGAAWRASYFDLMERAKRTGTDFETTLRAMHARTGTVEASFSSKLVATLDPTRPVLDAFVLKYFGLRLPYAYQDDRLGRTVVVYRRVADGIARIVGSEIMPSIRQAFAERYPGARPSDEKMVDFVLWRVRPSARP